ncbi:TolC family protein [Parabacteroides sp. OttesenSCG-928-N08]|nr:TolC family protein [Parabacteroides sp. OttesenSCG-928-N08]
MKRILFVSLLLVGFAGRSLSQRVELTLDKTIAIAADSSLEAFRNKNLFLADYWQYRTYKAGRLPSLTLNVTPAQYNRDIIRRYDSENDIDIYRKQQFYYAGGGLQVKQNFDLLGGSFFLDSNLGYIRNLSGEKYSQFTTIPLRIGYSQDLLGYNPFYWEKRIEPLKYEKAKRDLLFNIEKISESATTYFFALAMAQAEYDLAIDNVASTDTLYRTGQQRHKIASITQADLLTLKLDAVNARNKLQNVEIDLKRAMFSLAAFLNFDKNTEIRIKLPQRPREMNIAVDQALLYARDNNPTFLELQQQILEAEQRVDLTRKESMFNASLSASIGFNQVAGSLKGAYHDPMRQDVVMLSVSIPLIDWGVRRGKYNVARNNLNVTEISVRQKELTLEEDVIMTVRDFNIQQDLIGSAEEAMELANQAYNETKERFMIGKADINSLTLSLNRQQEAQRNFISALRNYWLSYYKIRKLTLHDFEANQSLPEAFDYMQHVR